MKLEEYVICWTSLSLSKQVLEDADHIFKIKRLSINMSLRFP